MKIGFQMDPIESLNIAGDSSFALMIEANKRGHDVFHFTPNELMYKNAEVFALSRKLDSISDNTGDLYKIVFEKLINLKSLDIVFLRQDPPFNMAYITSTYLLEMIENDVKIINRPSEVRNCPEKVFLNKWPDLSPSTLITRNINEINNFREIHKSIIIKPLYGNGGSGVFLLKKNDKNFSSIIETFLEKSMEPLIFQEYLPEIKNGDKRIILIDGEPSGIINRIPSKNEFRANLHVGGRATKDKLNKNDKKICSIIAPELKKRGLFFVGIDIIGESLTEINVTSPTGIREIKQLTNINLAEEIIFLLENS
tara:strand:- start:959 stop:1891 length:933 start_codon:yes stop_codon:yes gene_type:complete